MRRVEHAEYPVRRRWRQGLIGAGQPLLPTRYTYLVDPDSGAPVELRADVYNRWSNAGRARHWLWATEFTRFERFEHLEDSAATRALLTIALPSGTRVYRSAADGSFAPTESFRQAMAGQRDAMRRCNASVRNVSGRTTTP